MKVLSFTGSDENLSLGPRLQVRLFGEWIEIWGVLSFCFLSPTSRTCYARWDKCGGKPAAGRGGLLLPSAVMWCGPAPSLRIAAQSLQLGTLRLDNCIQFEALHYKKDIKLPKYIEINEADETRVVRSCWGNWGSVVWRREGWGGTSSLSTWKENHTIIKVGKTTKIIPGHF